MNKIFYLSSCSTCRKILADIADTRDFQLQDIKHEPLKPSELDHLKSLSGSYSSLFSTKARLYTSMGLKDRELSETDLRKLILEEYTFLKRPVVVMGDRIFIGSDRRSVDALKRFLGAK